MIILFPVVVRSSLLLLVCSRLLKRLRKRTICTLYFRVVGMYKITESEREREGERDFDLKGSRLPLVFFQMRKKKWTGNEHLRFYRPVSV